MLRNITTNILRCRHNYRFLQNIPIAFYSDIKPIKMAYTLYETAETDESATPLIIMHGLFGSKKNWRTVSRVLELKLKRRIYTVDARNHGDSPHTSEHGAQHMAADIADLILRTKMGKAVVMGHSMGGRAMMFLALKYPQLVDRGIVVDISPISVPGDFDSMVLIFDAMKNMKIDKTVPIREGRRMVEEQIQNQIGTKSTLDFILMNLRRRDNGEYYWAMNVDSLRANLRVFREFMSFAEGLAPYNGPMLFISGTLSNFLDPTHFPLIQKVFPNSKLEQLDAGHLVHFDQPELFIELVVNFVKTK